MPLAPSPNAAVIWLLVIAALAFQAITVTLLTGRLVRRLSVLDLNVATILLWLNPPEGDRRYHSVCALHPSKTAPGGTSQCSETAVSAFAFRRRDAEAGRHRQPDPRVARIGNGEAHHDDRQGRAIAAAQDCAAPARIASPDDNQRELRPLLLARTTRIDRPKRQL